MASLFLPRAGQAPPSDARVNASHPLAAGLSVCGLYGSGSHVERVSAESPPARWLEPDPMGGLIAGSFSAKMIPLNKAATYEPTITLLVTGYAYASPGFGTAGEQYLVAAGNASAVSSGRGLTFWNSNVRQASGGSSTAFSRGPFVAVQVIAVPNSGFGTITSWFNGAQFASATNVFGDKAQSHWGVVWGDTTANTTAITMSCAWTRALGDDDVRAVMAEPYAFLTR